MSADDHPVPGTPSRQRWIERLDIDPSVWVAPGAVVVGQVRLARDASVWYGCVLRGDLAPIEVGERTNIQDLTVVHVDIDQPAIIGNDVTVGHRSIVHGCTVEDGTLIGMGAVLLSGCRVGPEALVAAGAVVRENYRVPPGSIAAGVPARIVGEVTPELAERIRDGVSRYRETAAAYRARRLADGPYSGRAERPAGDGA